MPTTILIVEDNELNMKLFADILESQQFEVVKTDNGLDAKDLALAYRPDLIIMDIQLEGISGLEVAKWMKQNEKTSHIPILAVTAFAMKGDEERILQGGCEAYLSKPIDVAGFVQTVKNLLN